MSTEEEFPIEVPRPLQAPPGGRYIGLELHAIEFYIPYHYHDGQSAQTLVSITTSPRNARTPFMTQAGDPENLFWYEQRTYGDHVGGIIHPRQDQTTNRVDFTDASGHGRLLVGENIYVQLSSNVQVETEVTAGFKCYYTYTTLSCNEYVQELAANASTA